jgi:predicted unusual protein kinase regulating ubiquinone biosynthesis (AarF/ABC1/UbiB family)
MSKLQDAAPPTPLERVCQTVCDELGQTPQELFAEFDERTPSHTPSATTPITIRLYQRK